MLGSRNSFEGSVLAALLLQQHLELDKSTLSFYSVGPAPLPGGPVVSFSVLRQPSPVYFGAPGESPSLAPGANAGAVTRVEYFGFITMEMGHSHGQYGQNY